MYRTIKHCVKLLIGKTDPSWPLYVFEERVQPDTWQNRPAILARAENDLAQKSTYEAPERYELSDNPLVRQGYTLKQKTEAHFKNLMAGGNLRILIHVPDQHRSPAGYSLFKNFAEAFRFIGIPTEDRKSVV